MNNNYTHITFVIDRSGSMESTIGEVVGGFNRLIREQREQAGSVTISAISFADRIETLYRFASIKDIGVLKREQIEPRGYTSLYDAVGRAIVETGQTLARLPEQNRPGKVVVVIMTDGEDNLSEEYNALQIKAMVEHQRSVYNWEFIFLGASEDAVAVGASLGVDIKSSGKYKADRMGTQALYKCVSQNIGTIRTATARGVSYELDMNPN